MRGPSHTMEVQQADGHPEVVIKNMPRATGSLVAVVPNGEQVRVFGVHGAYMQVSWGQISGYIRSQNVRAVRPQDQFFKILARFRHTKSWWWQVLLFVVSALSLPRCIRSCLKKWVCSKQWNVFASYSQTDPYTKFLVRMVKLWLKLRGFSLFVDVDDLAIITKQELEACIANSNIFLLFLDDKVLDRKWCEFEIFAALKHKVPIHVVVDNDYYRATELITLWRDTKNKGTARYLFGNRSHPLISHSSVMHAALNEDAMLKIEQRIELAFNE